MICVIVDDFERLLAAVLSTGLSRALSTKIAETWVAEHFAPAQQPHRRGLQSLKHQYENEHPGRYLHLADMAAAFRQNGIRVVGDRVFCRERGNNV